MAGSIFLGMVGFVETHIFAGLKSIITKYKLHYENVQEINIQLVSGEQYKDSKA